MEFRRVLFRSRREPLPHHSFRFPCGSKSLRADLRLRMAKRQKMVRDRLHERGGATDEDVRFIARGDRMASEHRFIDATMLAYPARGCPASKRVNNRGSA